MDNFDYLDDVPMICPNCRYEGENYSCKSPEKIKDIENGTKKDCSQYCVYFKEAAYWIKKRKSKVGGEQKMKISEEQIKVLDEFWENHPAEVKDGSYSFFNDHDSKDALDVEDIFFDYLCPNGHFNMENKAILAEHGYHARVTDGDSFGILVCCVTKNGKTFSVG